MAMKSTMYGVQLDNRIYKVCVEQEENIVNEDFADLIASASFCVNLETREILTSNVLPDVKSISESNPLYHILTNLTLITLDHMWYIEAKFVERVEDEISV